MNKTLNIRIIELLTTEKRTSFKYLYFLTHTTGNEHKETKMKITTNKSGRILICEKPITFNIDSQLHNTIYMNFKRHRLIIHDDFIGEVVLPMSWFPSNHIVREWFPIVNQINGQNRGMVLLDVHVDCRGADPFMAPFAPLNVRPNWRIPELNENAEVLVNHNFYEANEANTQNFIPNAVLIQNVPPNYFYPVYQLPIVYNHQIDLNANNQFVQQRQQQQIDDCQDDSQKRQNDLKNNDVESMPQQQDVYPQLQNNFQQPVFYPQIPQNVNPYSNG